MTGHRMGTPLDKQHRHHRRPEVLDPQKYICQTSIQAGGVKLKRMWARASFASAMNMERAERNTVQYKTYDAHTLNRISN